MKMANPCRWCTYNPCRCHELEPYEVGSAFGGPVCIMVHPDPKICGCGGSGWQGTELDSVHRCPNHEVTNHHPDCEGTRDDLSCCKR